MTRFCHNLHQVLSTLARVMAFNATINNISVISWRSVVLVEETGVSGENHRPATNHWQTLLHNVKHIGNSYIFYVVCYSSVYGFWLPLSYLQTLLNEANTFIVISKIEIVYLCCFHWKHNIQCHQIRTKGLYVQRV